MDELQKEKTGRDINFLPMKSNEVQRNLERHTSDLGKFY